MKNLFYFLSIILLFAACKSDEIVELTNTPIINPPMDLVTASVTGTVLDEAGDYLPDATVDYRGRTVETDKYGRFTFSNMELFEDGTYLTVSKSGYFKGSRKFYAKENIHSEITVQLIKRLKSATISAADGGVASFESASVDLPSGTYRTAQDEAYNGQVAVYAFWLNPEEEATFDRMPGDLSGITTEGELSGLKTYGMVAVELEDDNGNALKLPEGETATINLGVPASLMGHAPSTIPLWYFDEINGTWIEEGEAQLINGEYIGEVSHFTYWNCDVPFNFVEISGNLRINSTPVEAYVVKVTTVSQGLYGRTLTGTDGFFSLLVPKNEELVLEVSGHCGGIGSETNIGSFSADEYIGVLDADVSLGDFSLTGSATNCNGGAAEFAYVQVTIDGGYPQVITIEDDGSFYQDFSDCQGNEATAIVINPSDEMQSEPIDFVTTGFVDLGTISTCEPETNNNEFVIAYNGQNWALSSTTTDSLLIGTYNIQEFNNGNGTSSYIYEVTILDWLTAQLATGTFEFADGDTEAPYTLELPQGFEVSGIAQIQELPELRFTGIGTDITVTDPDKYPGNVDQVYFDFKFY